MRLTIRLGAVSLAALVAACGGGGDTAPTYNAMFAEFEALEPEIENANRFLAAGLPDTGSAGYDGVLFYNLRNAVQNDQGTILGELSVRTNFQDNTFSGSASNFRDRFENEYAGSLTLSNGAINEDPVNFSLAADIDGVISGGPEGSMSVDARFQGDFYGPAYRYIGGTLDGGVSVNDGTAITLDDQNSAFVAERQ